MVGLIRVFIGLVTVLFSLWVFSIVAPAIIEPLVSVVLDQPVVTNGPMSGDADRVQQVTLLDAPTLLGAGFIVLTILYAVFRELFTTPGRRL